MSARPDLSVVVPVHNCADHLETLVETLLRVPDTSVEAVLVDDASTDGSSEIVDELATGHFAVRAMHHPANLGAGAARNTGFDATTGRYTLFFDADDRLHVESVAAAVTALDETSADLAFLPYRYIRGLDNDNQAMNHYDLEVWDRYMSNRMMRVASLSEVPSLLGFSNYPWNKIHRTDRYRSVGLRFSTTPVHNDVLAHWYGLLFAGKLVLLDREMCTHIVHAKGGNLSNRHNSARLTLFDALDETYGLLSEHPDLRRRYAHHYWGLVIRVTEWARARLANEYHEEFSVRLSEHVEKIDLTDFVRIRARRDPRLADSIVDALLT